MLVALFYFIPIAQSLKRQLKSWDDPTPSRKWPSPMRTWPPPPVPKQTWPTDPAPWPVKPPPTSTSKSDDQSKKGIFSNPIILGLLGVALVAAVSVVYVILHKGKRDIDSTIHEQLIVDADNV